MTKKWVLPLLFAAGCGGLPVDESDYGLARTPPAPSLARSSPWLVLLCKASDHPEEPATPDMYDRMFTARGAGTGNVGDYFEQMSYGQMNLKGTQVRGWFNVPMTADQLRRGFVATRADRVANCLLAAEAADPSLSPKAFDGIAAFYNCDVDGGAMAVGAVTLPWIDDTKAYMGLVGTDFFSSLAFSTHEMLHGYGQHHAHGLDPMLTQYGDEWSVMGTGSRVYPGPYGAAGSDNFVAPGMTAFEREKMGWIDPGRIYTWGAAGTAPLFDETITLTASNLPNSSAPMVVKVPVPDGNYYNIEFRKRDASFDRNLRFDAVLVRKIMWNDSYLPSWDNPSTGGGLRPGDFYSSVADNLYVTVLRFDPLANTATIVVRLRGGSGAPPVGKGPKPKPLPTTSG